MRATPTAGGGDDGEGGRVSRGALRRTWLILESRRIRSVESIRQISPRPVLSPLPPYAARISALCLLLTPAGRRRRIGMRRGSPCRTRPLSGGGGGAVGCSRMGVEEKQQCDLQFRWYTIYSSSYEINVDAT
uniref:Uncharacterized protein n=2 Tax=Oryza TaxID=4527 RepID=I1QP47_ORYGL